MTANSTEADMGRRLMAIEDALYNLQRERRDSLSTIDNCPTGMVAGFQTSTPPQAWLPLDGSVTVTALSHPALYAYLTANGLSLTLADWRGKMPIGAGGTYSGTSTGGSADSTVTTHTHPGFDHTHGTNVKPTSAEASGFGLTASTSFENRVRINGTGDTTGTDGAAYNTGSSGVSGTGTNLPPYRGLYWMIRT